MKKQVKIILIVIISFIVLYGAMFFTDMNRVKQLKKPIFCIENGYMGSMRRFDGLGYKIGLEINATTGEITSGQMTMLGQFIVELDSEDEDATLSKITIEVLNGNQKIEITNAKDIEKIKNLLLSSKYDNELCWGINTHKITMNDEIYYLKEECKEIQKGDKQAEISQEELDTILKIIDDNK